MVYNPFTGFPVTDDWDAHKRRGSLGGIDYAMSVGTPLPSCANATIYNAPDNGTGGHTVTMVRALGIKTQYMHLSRFAVNNGTVVNQGDIVGYSGGAKGAPGSGSSEGPHVHCHDIDANGNRIPPFSGANNSNEEENDMKLWLYENTNTMFVVDHIRMVARAVSGWERVALQNDIDAGVRRIDRLSDKADNMAWTNTFKNYRFIGNTPEPIGGSVNLTSDQLKIITDAVNKTVVNEVAKIVPDIVKKVKIELAIK